MLPLLLQKIAGAKLLVVGDAMLDRYWYGDVERISPEAPVPVASIRRADERAGGAANVVCNAAALGAKCRFLSICGDDPEAAKLESILEGAGVSVRLERDKLINTTIKLRVISRNQQLIRIDFDSPGSHDARVRMLDVFLKEIKKHDALIISDYGKGGIGYVQEMIDAARRVKVPVLVDPKGDDYSHYRGATVVTPNRKEFEQVAGRARDEADLEKRAAAMVAALELGGVLVTRGEEGMSYFAREGEVLHIPAHAREVYDVTGAGDTVIAAIGCAYAGRAKVLEALQLANVAAGIVVGKLGAATVTPQEVLQALAHQEH